MPRTEVAALATEHVEVAPGPRLIGLFHRPGGSVALVSEPGGQVRRLSRGSRLGDAIVAAIGETSLFLHEGGEEKVLSLPV